MQIKPRRRIPLTWLEVGQDQPHRGIDGFMRKVERKTRDQIQTAREANRSCGNCRFSWWRMDESGVCTTQIGFDAEKMIAGKPLRAAQIHFRNATACAHWDKR